MDIYKHKEILLKWIRSCQTAQQLDLFTRLVTEFDVTQYYDEIDPYEMELARIDLSDAIIERRVIVAGKIMQMRSTTHYLVVPNGTPMYLSE